MSVRLDKVDKPEPSTPERLLRLWRTAGVPVDDPDRQAARRVKTVGVVAAAMRAASRQRVRRRRLTAGLLAAAAVSVLGVGSSWLIGGSQAELTSAEVLEGSVMVERSGETLELQGGAAVSPGDSLRTRSERAQVRLGAHKIRLSRNTKARIGPILRLRHRVTLANGGIDFDVDRSSADERFVVATHDAEVVVRGTLFRVEVSGEGVRSVTTVTVSRGSVRVEPKHGAQVLLHAGDRWSSSSVSDAAVDLQDADHQDVTEATGQVARAQTDAQPPVSSAAEGERGQKSRARAKPVRDSGLRGRKVETRGAKALKGSLAQENALFQAALQARNANNDALALRYLESLLARFPKSTLAQEARVERFRALKRLGETAEAARSARRYLAEHRDGFARKEARELVLKSVLKGH